MFSHLNSFNDVIKDRAITELNHRFKEHAVGYQFINDEIIRTDSQFLHSEAVVPTLHLLNNDEFKNVEDEFLLAHAAYRHGDINSALIECHKAFESTMKVIIHKRKWAYDTSENKTDKSEAKEKASASRLISICLENDLLPKHFDSQLTTIKTLLESSIPTLRNKYAAHGTDLESKKPPAYFASFMLHMTASTILFLIEADKSSQ